MYAHKAVDLVWAQIAILDHSLIVDSKADFIAAKTSFGWKQSQLHQVYLLHQVFILKYALNLRQNVLWIVLVTESISLVL